MGKIISSVERHQLRIVAQSFLICIANQLALGVALKEPTV